MGQTLVTIELECRCGGVTAKVAGQRRDYGPRLICMCDDCQVYAHFLERQDDVLDECGGTDIFVCRPSCMQITRGAENLRCIRLSDVGMYRWYASCCRTPIANSTPSRLIPYIGIHSYAVKSGDLGRVTAKVQARFGIAPIPTDASPSAPAHLIVVLVIYMVRGLLRRQHAPTPFLTGSDHRPINPPAILDPQALQELRRRLR